MWVRNVPAVTQLCYGTRPGCWQPSWQPHQACSLLGFLTHVLGMLLQPVIYPSQVSSQGLLTSTALIWQPRGKLKCIQEWFASHLWALVSCFSVGWQNQIPANNQTLCIMWAADSGADRLALDECEYWATVALWLSPPSVTLSKCEGLSHCKL